MMKCIRKWCGWLLDMEDVLVRHKRKLISVKIFVSWPDTIRSIILVTFIDQKEQGGMFVCVINWLQVHVRWCCVLGLTREGLQVKERIKCTLVNISPDQ